MSDKVVEMAGETDNNKEISEKAYKIAIDAALWATENNYHPADALTVLAGAAGMVVPPLQMAASEPALMPTRVIAAQIGGANVAIATMMKGRVNGQPFKPPKQDVVAITDELANLARIVAECVPAADPPQFLAAKLLIQAAAATMARADLSPQEGVRVYGQMCADVVQFNWPGMTGVSFTAAPAVARAKNEPIN